jgi:hypothetical protein
MLLQKKLARFGQESPIDKLQPPSKATLRIIFGDSTARRHGLLTGAHFRRECQKEKAGEEIYVAYRQLHAVFHG